MLNIPWQAEAYHSNYQTGAMTRQQQQKEESRATCTAHMAFGLTGMQSHSQTQNYK